LNISAPKLGSSASAAEEKQGKDDNRSHVMGQIINKYHLQISTSLAFAPLVLDEINPIKDKANIDFKKYHLPDSIYYYRFAYVDELGFEGQYSTPIQFTIDTMPPVLSVETPQNEEEVDSEFIHVEGLTEPQAHLKVNDKAVAVDDKGKFVTALIPKSGWNSITLIAEDEAGNITKQELSVNSVKVAHKKTAVVQKKVKEKSLTFASISLGILTAAVIIGVVLLIVQ